MNSRVSEEQIIDSLHEADAAMPINARIGNSEIAAFAPTAIGVRLSGGRSLDAIADFIHRDSPQHARRVVDAALDLAASIVEQPWIGRVVPELDDPNIRE